MFEAHLEEVLVRSADERGGLDVEDLHDPAPVEVGADRGELLLFGERRDPRFEVVVGEGEPVGLLPVPGRDVGAGEDVESGEQGAGIRDVAAHRRIRPPGVAVPVEPQVEFDEAAHGLRRVLVEAQRLHPLRGELRAHDVVVVEGHGPARGEVPRRGLADVVHEGGEADDEVGFGQVLRIGGVESRLPLAGGVGGFKVDGLAQHGEAVLVDVLVPVVFVCLEPQAGDLGQHMVGDARAHEQVDAGGGVEAGDEFDEFDLDAFGGDDRDALGHLRHRRFDGRIGGEAQLCGEAGCAHHPQRVVGEGVRGRAGGADPAGHEVLEALMRVDEGPLGQAHGHRPDREVATDEIGVEVGAEADDGFARIRLVRLGAVGRDLDLHTGLHRPDRAELAPDVPVGVRPADDEGEDVIRSGVGGEVEVGHRPAHEGVAHRAADEGELEPRLGEAAAERAEDAIEFLELVVQPNMRALRVHRTPSPRVPAGPQGHGAMSNLQPTGSASSGTSKNRPLR